MENINSNDNTKLNVPHNNGVVTQDRDSMIYNKKSGDSGREYDASSKSANHNNTNNKHSKVKHGGNANGNGNKTFLGVEMVDVENHRDSNSNGTNDIIIISMTPQQEGNLS